MLWRLQDGHSFYGNICGTYMSTISRAPFMCHIWTIYGLIYGPYMCHECCHKWLIYVSKYICVTFILHLCYIYGPFMSHVWSLLEIFWVKFAVKMFDNMHSTVSIIPRSFSSASGKSIRPNYKFL